MVSKKKIIKFKLNFHKSPRRRKTQNASKMISKNDSSKLMANTKTLPRVHIFLTRLMPTKMPDIAKNQYYKLVKSSGLLSVLPADKSSWDGLSPEATPEREFGVSSRSSDLLSPITRTQLQLSPFDLEDTHYTDLRNEPWSVNSEPYPSPKSPENNDNEQTVCWVESPEVKKTCSFEHQEVEQSPCDNEVEAIMARQNCEVPEKVPDIPIYRPQPSNVLVQTVIIPIEPVDKRSCSLDVTRDDSPVFDRDGIWTSPGRKWSTEKTQEVQKVGLKRKRGRPKKKQKVPSLTPSSVDLSSSRPANDVQGTEQENVEERIAISEEGTSSTTGTELPSKNSRVEKGTSKKRGRPRKCRRLHSDPVPNNSVDVDLSYGNARNTLICPPEGETRAEEETSSRVNKNVEKEESPVILEQAVDNNNSTLQASSRKLTDVTEDKRFADKESYVNTQIDAHPTQGSRLANEQTLLLGSRETSSQSIDFDSMEEVASERIPEEDDERVGETPVTPPSTGVSAVHIESSPLIKSLKFNGIINEEKSPIRSTVFLASQGEKYQLSYDSESTFESTPQERLPSLRQELFPGKELDTSANVLNCQLRSRTLSETSELRVTLRPLGRVRLSTSSSEDVAVMNKEDEFRECLGSVGGKTSPLRRLSVVCERLPNSVLDNNDMCSGSSLSENSTSNENINIGSEVTKRSLSFVRGRQSDKRSPQPGKRKPSVLCTDGKDKDSDQGQNELLEGKVELVPCSPIRILNSPEERLRKRSCSSIGSSKSGTPYSSTTTTNSGDKESSKKSSGRPKKKSMDNWLPPSPLLSPSKSNSSLLDGTVRLTPCSPIQVLGRKREERRNSAVRTSPRLNSASKTASPPNAFKSPVPLKNLVVECDRVPTGDYNVLKSPENVLVKPSRPKRTRNQRKVNVENKDTDKIEKKKTGTKRKRESKSPKIEKPKKKKRKLTIPDHYKNYKPCQLSSISHTQMRYRVAFNLWPQKFSGALDKINQRLINQNAFWKSLG